MNASASPDLRDSVDFTLAFACRARNAIRRPLLPEVAQASKPGASLLLVETAGHVKEAEFTSELEAAARVGLSLAGHPLVGKSHTALLRKASGRNGFRQILLPWRVRGCVRGSRAWAPALHTTSGLVALLSNEWNKAAGSLFGERGFSLELGDELQELRFGEPHRND